MAVFISNKHHRGLLLLGETFKDESGNKDCLKIKFNNFGHYGCYETENEKELEFLRKHKLNGEAFKEQTSKFDIPKDEFEESPKIEVKPTVDIKKVLRLGELKAKVLDSEGAVRKTAPKELKEEYEKLNLELKDLI